MSSETAVTSVQPPLDRPLEPTTRLSGARVFVAEDEPIILFLLEDVLGDFGCTVVGRARWVSEALAFVTSQVFDVAVLDCKLADGTIEPVIDVLAARGIPFIIASGASSTDFTDLFGSAIAVQKPYKVADLRQALIRALAQGSA